MTGTSDPRDLLNEALKRPSADPNIMAMREAVRLGRRWHCVTDREIGQNYACKRERGDKGKRTLGEFNFGKRA